MTTCEVCGQPLGEIALRHGDRFDTTECCRIAHNCELPFVASPGKRGIPGEARKGDPGKPGPAITSGALDDDGILLLKNADGTEVRVDFYPVLAKLSR